MSEKTITKPKPTAKRILATAVLFVGSMIIVAPAWGVVSSSLKLSEEATSITWMLLWPSLQGSLVKH